MMLHSQSVENCNDKLIFVREVISALLGDPSLIRGACIKHVLQLGSYNSQVPTSAWLINQLGS